MIEIQNCIKTDEPPKELKGYESIEVLEVAGKKDGSHDVLYYCVLDGILTKVMSRGSINSYLSTSFRRGNLRNKIQDLYAVSSKDITGFRPYKSFRSLINKLFLRFEGCSIDEALLNLSSCIRQYQGGADSNQVLRPEFGIIVGFEKPDIRRYSDNDRKDTFDIVDIVIKTTMSDPKYLKEWYDDDNNRRALVLYALDKISNNRSYIRYGVSTDYLKLINAGVGKGQFRLVFGIKEINNA